MIASAAEERRGIDYILDTISKYNHSKRDIECIKFIHGGSSAKLAYIGKRSTVTRHKTSEIVTIPIALIPCKSLRKKYGIDLFLQTSGSKKDLVSYNNLLGAVVNHDGISMCYQHANQLNPIKITDLHRAIITTILQMEPHTYIRNLKKLLTLMTNMMLMDPKANEKTEYYLDLLKTVRKNLREKINAQYYFDRYLPRLEHILKANTIPFQADDKFRTEVLNQYPIIFCSSVEAKDLSESSHRRCYDSELGLDRIRILFTPQQHVSRLKAKIKEIGLSEKIKVYGYVLEASLENPYHLESQDEQEVAAFLQAVSCEELLNIADKNPIFISARKIVEEKIMNCLTAYLDGKGSENLAMASWLIKSADSNTMENMTIILNDCASVALYELLQNRARKDNAYFQIVAHIMSRDYLSRLGETLHLKALLSLRQCVNNVNVLFDYEKELTDTELHARIKPEEALFPDRAKYLCEYLSRLQNLYAVLMRGQASGKIRDNLNQRIRFIKIKYGELLQEYGSISRIDDQTINSELYQSINEKELMR